MTREEFLQGTNIIEQCTQKKMNKNQIDVYYMILKNLSLEQFQNGLGRMFSERVYTNIPSPGEINQYCLDRKDIKIKAAHAREKMRIAAKKISAYQSIAFDDPIIHKIIMSVGSWSKVVKMPLKDLHDFLEFDFEKLYLAYDKLGIGEIPLFFEGIHDAQNDVQSPEIKLVGDKSKYNRWAKCYNEKMLKGEIPKFVTELKNINELIEFVDYKRIK